MTPPPAAFDLQMPTGDDWTEEAACRSFPTELFFPDSGVNIAPIKRICADCPVKNQCLAAGIDERYGVWGGTSVVDRQRIRQRAGKLCPRCHEPFVNLARHVHIRHPKAA